MPAVMDDKKIKRPLGEKRMEGPKVIIVVLAMAMTRSFTNNGNK